MIITIAITNVKETHSKSFDVQLDMKDSGGKYDNLLYFRYALWGSKCYE